MSAILLLALAQSLQSTVLEQDTYTWIVDGFQPTCFMFQVMLPQSTLHYMCNVQKPKPLSYHQMNKSKLFGHVCFLILKLPGFIGSPVTQ